MILKERSKPTELIMLRYLNARMSLTAYKGIQAIVS